MLNNNKSRKIPKMEPKRLSNQLDAESLLASKIHTFPQGVLCRSPCLVLAPFWLHFGRFWHPFGSILVHFGSLFGQNNPVRYPFRTTSAKNRRHLRQRKSCLCPLSPQATCGILPLAIRLIDPHVAAGQRACLDASTGSFSAMHSTSCISPCTPPFAFLFLHFSLCTPPFCTPSWDFSDNFPAQFV